MLEQLVLVIEDNCWSWMRIGANRLDLVWVECYKYVILLIIALKRFSKLLIPTRCIFIFGSIFP